MNKHTPAPWGIEIAADGLNKWVGCSRYSVATIAQLPNQVNIGEADANARLIAAAPELLEALKASVELVEREVTQADSLFLPSKQHQNLDGTPIRSFESKLYEIAAWRAAIAKAEGGAA
jgi:hypothetical protein